MPHYAWEIVFYAALVTLQPTHAPTWLCLGWVTTNLTLSASRSHAWYQERFGAKFANLKRWVIIPGVF